MYYVWIISVLLCALKNKMAKLSPEEWECIDRLGMNIVMMAWVMITRTVCAQGTKFKFVMCRGGYGGLRTNISVMLIRRWWR